MEKDRRTSDHLVFLILYWRIKYRATVYEGFGSQRRKESNKIELESSAWTLPVHPCHTADSQPPLWMRVVKPRGWTGCPWIKLVNRCSWVRTRARRGGVRYIVTLEANPSYRSTTCEENTVVVSTPGGVSTKFKRKRENVGSFGNWHGGSFLDAGYAVLPPLMKVLDVIEHFKMEFDIPFL